MSEPRILIAPSAGDQLGPLVEGAGARVVHDPGEADAVVWTDPGDPDGLGDLLQRSPARWVQLPFAGIEEFLTAKSAGD